MISVRNIILSACALFFSGYLLGQSKEVKEWEAKAEELFEMREFAEAIPYYKNLLGEKPGTFEYTLNLGIAYLYKPDEHDKAFEYLESIKERDPETPGIDFYLGKAYAYSYQFDDAIKHFNAYRNTVDPNDLNELIVVDRYIASCEKAKEMYENPVKAVIRPLEGKVNTKFSEYAPLISADGSTLVYTYRGEKSTGNKQYYLSKYQSYGEPGEYREDIFISKKTDGSFGAPEPMGESINSEGNDAAIALSADGQKLYIFKSTLDNSGDIYVSKLNGTTWSEPTRLEGGVNSAYWEGSCALSPDGQTLYFVSERPGGEGGKDLYSAKIMSDSASSPDREYWGSIENLGSQINTPFEEDAPFVHPNGTLLIFSSTGHEGMGGYDVYRSENRRSTWQSPENLGYPVNSTGDDLYYTLSPDLKKGYYSSFKRDGKGEQDIYVVAPGLPGVSPMILLSGTVTLDTIPVEADISILYEDDEVFGDFTANSATGEYDVPLPAGSGFKLTFTTSACTECDPVVEIVDASGIKEYTERTLDIEFFTEEYLARLDSIKKTNAEDSLADTGDSDDGGDDSDLGMEHTSASEYVDEFGNAPPPGYYIIIGSFKNQANATRLKEQMIEEGVDSCKIMLYQKINFYRVVHSFSPDSPDPLRRDYKELRAGEFPRTWILHLE